MEILSYQGMHYLVAATVSKYKEDPADWSRPGDLAVISLEDFSDIPWKSIAINAGITRNHGMTRAFFNGEESIFVSGAEGIFKILPANNGWGVEIIFPREVSEMTFIDLDGDGFHELITIEPFHGNTINVYKQIENSWELLFSDSLSFGHGLSSGFFNGKPLIVAGNRSESLALETFTISNLLKGIVNRKVIEENAGPTQTQIFSHQSVDYILSANQRKNEVALYSGSLD